MRTLSLIGIVLLFVSCLKEPNFQSYQVNLTVDFGENISATNKTGAKVILFNQLKSYSIELKTDSEGKVCFSSIEPGFYNVTVVHSISTGGFVYYYNGLKTIQVFNAVSDTIQAKGSSSSAFVIKEFYYSGSTTPAGKTYSADQYLEIFNNSPEIQYAAGISILEHESNGASDNFWANIKDTIVVKMIWTIPGNGNQVPVLPGKSIVLAKDGINHRGDPNGNPLSPVNMENADFEFYVLKQPEADIDSPNVPNLIEDLYVNRGNDADFHVKGGSALSIAKIPGNTDEDRKTYIKKHQVSKLSASGSKTTYYAKIANEYVIDAVEVVFDEAHAIYKRFPSSLDAGYTYVPSGSNSGKCIRRKTKENINGRVVYQDTNNSTEDFLKDVDPRPKIYEN